MPLDLKAFGDGEEPQERAASIKKGEVFEFLKKNKKQAFTQKEVQVECGFNHSPAARSVLMQLIKDGVVGRKSCPITDSKGGTVNRIHYAYVQDYPKPKK